MPNFEEKKFLSAEQTGLTPEHIEAAEWALAEERRFSEKFPEGRAGELAQIFSCLTERILTEAQKEH